MKIKRFAYIPSGTDLSALYRERVGDYPKFFKMDLSSKLGFLLTEMLVGGDPDRFEPRDDRAVLMFSRWGCLSNDRRYEETAREFPSPALFVYTLPNVVTGEIAIRNKYRGETSAYVLDGPDFREMAALVGQAFSDRATRSAVCGWLDAHDEADFAGYAVLVESDENDDKLVIMKELIEEIKTKVIAALNLEGMQPEDIADDAPLFGDEGLGLDSIDVLELIVLLEKEYGIRLANPAEGKKVFGSVAMIAGYVAENRKK